MESSKQTRHVSLATAESVVRSSQSDINETLMRSHLERERGFVDERRTHVCPELDESAHTRDGRPVAIVPSRGWIWEDAASTGSTAALMIDLRGPAPQERQKVSPETRGCAGTHSPIGVVRHG